MAVSEGVAAFHQSSLSLAAFDVNKVLLGRRSTKETKGSVLLLQLCKGLNGIYSLRYESLIKDGEANRRFSLSPLNSQSILNRLLRF
eukprot:scaffold20203_cov132-Skeletonema_dohrnii-CCMP3373.AAC.3